MAFTILTSTVNADNSVTLTGTGGPAIAWTAVNTATGTEKNSGTIPQASLAPPTGTVGVPWMHTVDPLPNGIFLITMTGPGGSTASVTVTIP
jgi:hypothetical protein